MIDTQKPDQDERTPPARSIETALPAMKERARDHIHLMFLVDDFQRALELNMEIVSCTVSRFSSNLSEQDREKLEFKLSAGLEQYDDKNVNCVHTSYNHVSLIRLVEILALQTAREAMRGNTGADCLDTDQASTF